MPHEKRDFAQQEQEREQLALERERLVAQEGQERWARILGPCLRVGVICGGTGASREASLHSARTLLDQLDTIHHLQAGKPCSRVHILTGWCLSMPAEEPGHICHVEEVCHMEGRLGGTLKCENMGCTFVP